MTMTTETREKTVKWYTNELLIGRQFDEIDFEGQEAICNLLAGFLQACEKFDLMTHDEAQELFTELVNENDLSL